MSEENVNAVKAWLTPIIMSILGVMIWHDVTEMKNDIKALLTKGSANEIRIQRLEKDIDLIQKQLYLGIGTSRYAKKEDEELNFVKNDK